MTTQDDKDCRELVEQVTEYLDAVMPAAERERFERHAAECPGCAEIIAQFRVVIAQTGALRAADVAALEPGQRDELLGLFRTRHNDPGGT